MRKNIPKKAEIAAAKERRARLLELYNTGEYTYATIGKMQKPRITHQRVTQLLAQARKDLEKIGGCQND